MDKEKLKIVSFNPLTDISTIYKLNELSSFFNTSNRRLIQLAIAYSHNILSLPKPGRNYTNGKRASTVFIPFTEKGLSRCVKHLKDNHISFKAFCIQSIDNLYTSSKNIDLSKERLFHIYVSQNLHEFIDSQI